MKPLMGYVAQVLIVEDDNELCDLLKIVLDQLDHRYFTANTLTSARELLKSEKIDVMLLDLYLPDGTGIDLLSDLRNSEPPPPPTIVMTAYGNWETHLKAYHLGAFYYLDKPFRVTQLKILVHQALTGKD
jgi:two-component system, NtrC family, response regulator PilR